MDGGNVHWDFQRGYELPELGVGMIYAPGLEPVFEKAQDLLDVIEIEPQPLWFKSSSPAGLYRNDTDALRRLARFPQPKLIHGVGFPVGGSLPVDSQFLAPFLEAVNWFGPAWVSEHLSFNLASDGDSKFNTGFLLPPLQSTEGVSIAASNIRHLRSRLPVPFAFETGVNYMQPQAGEMSDGAFFRAVAEEADCGILLDLHNLWANEQNGREPLLDVIAELPLGRVWEIHLAGGQERNGYWLDAHSGLIPGPLMDVAQEVLGMLPNVKAILFEIMPDYIRASNLPTSALLNQLRDMRKLWLTRKQPTTMCRVTREYERGEAVRSIVSRQVSTAGEWESALGKLAIGTEPVGSLEVRLANDPGVRIFRELINSVRAGMAVTVLKLTCRYLRLSLGEAGLRELLEEFWKEMPPSPFASEEGENFAVFLNKRVLGIPHLEEVLEFELAVQKVIMEHTPKTVQFHCDPMPLLSAIGEGHLPNTIVPGEFEFTVEPDAHRN